MIETHRLKNIVIFVQTKERYSKEKPAEYYLQNKEVIKEKAKNCYKNFQKKKKTKLKCIKRKVSRIDSI